MDDAFTRPLDFLLNELQLYLTAVDANLAIMSHIVSPLLAGEEPTLLVEEEEFGQTLDAAIFQTTRAAMEVDEALDGQRPLLTSAQDAAYTQARAQLERLTDRWKELMEFVGDVWTLGRPPN